VSIGINNCKVLIVGDRDLCLAGRNTPLAQVQITDFNDTTTERMIDFNIVIYKDDHNRVLKMENIRS